MTLRAWILENIKQEMIRLKINTIGISKTRWQGQSDFYSDGFTVIHSRGEESQRGVAVMLDNTSSYVNISEKGEKGKGAIKRLWWCGEFMYELFEHLLAVFACLCMSFRILGVPVVRDTL